MDDPALPVYWGKNQAGMTAKEELSLEAIEECKDDILMLRDMAVAVAKRLHKRGLHKQTVNRYVEPWMWTKGVVTATCEAWRGLLDLRNHPDAQPEFKALAVEIERNIRNSNPTQLEWGEYHMPYVNKTVDMSVVNQVKLSTSCNAQVSYRVLDETLDKAIKIYDMLNLPVAAIYGEDPPHFSPTEHVALCYDGLWVGDSGNFHSDDWWQYRKALETGQEDLFIKLGEGK
jgi:hypothetical protein